jgi:hypothetical protein
LKVQIANVHDQNQPSGNAFMMFGLQHKITYLKENGYESDSVQRMEGKVEIYCHFNAEGLRGHIVSQINFTQNNFECASSSDN